MRVIAIGILALLSWSALAAQPDKVLLKCESVSQGIAKIYAEMELTTFGKQIDGNGAELRNLNLTLLIFEEKGFGIVPNTMSVIFEAKELKNVPYSGQKYAGHYKFSATGREINNPIQSVGQLDLIVSPEYKVIKTIPRTNDWDSGWTWEIEVRRHSAVVPLSIGDHYGDYVPLNCYSLAKVNEKRRRNKL